MEAKTVNMEWVGRVIRAATGEEWGDGYTVTDVVIGYAEPGYGTNESVVVFGNWNPKRFPRGDDAPLTREENLGPRLANALEWLGCDLQWRDEWSTCSECGRAMRTTADSYSWTMYGAFVECDYVCADCMKQDPETYLDEYVNNTDNAITWMEWPELSALGWHQWEPDEILETGWHPGQDADPKKVLERIRRETDSDVVFLIRSVGQFDVRWEAWVKDDEDDEDDEDAQ